MAHTGSVRITDDAVDYQSPDLGDFHVPITEIAAIGEYTTPYGPAADDYFLTLVTRDGRRYDLSAYDAGVREALDLLSHRLAAPLEQRLAHGTTFASRMLWPVQYADKPLFNYEQRAQPRGWRGRWQRILGVTTLDEELSPAAAQA